MIGLLDSLQRVDSPGLHTLYPAVLIEKCQLLRLEYKQVRVSDRPTDRPETEDYQQHHCKGEGNSRSRDGNLTMITPIRLPNRLNKEN